MHPADLAAERRRREAKMRRQLATDWRQAYIHATSMECDALLAIKRTVSDGVASVRDAHANVKTIRAGQQLRARAA